MTASFTQALEEAGVSGGSFRHRDHVRVAWLLLRREGAEAGSETFVRGLRAFAAAHRANDKYHETLTRFWLRLVAHTIEVRPQIHDADAFLAAFPFLLDKTLVERHWSRDALWSDDARMRYVEPDLLPLP